MRTVLIGLLTLLVMLPAAAHAEAPLLVVFDIEDKARALRASDKRSLGEYIAAKLAETGDYRVVPMSRLRKLLRQRKIRRCHEWGCKSSIGWEFKTHKLLATRLMRLGRQCVLTSNLHGLKSAAVERSATAKGACKQEALTASVERVVATLTGRGDVEPQQRAGRKSAEPGISGADEPGLSRGKARSKKRARKAKRRKAPPPKADEPGKPFPMWPSFITGSVGLAGIVAGAVLLHLDGKGANCEGPTQPNYENCADLYDTKVGGGIALALGMAGLAGTGLLLYFHFTSPREEKAASVGIRSVGIAPMPEGGAAFGITGRF